VKEIRGFERVQGDRQSPKGMPMAPLREASSDVVDATLVRQSCREPERFAILYDRHFGDVHRYLSGRMGREAADDLAAETFLIAFRKRAGFDQERGAVRPWLFGIATVLVAEHRRAEHRRLNALGRIAVETTTDGHEDTAGAGLRHEGAVQR
jgi:DNA-directed RNA polymerase specialized sigma24 family protein